jgi:hypothetical protein
MNIPETHTGGCLCGGVRYSARSAGTSTAKFTMPKAASGLRGTRRLLRCS